MRSNLRPGSRLEDQSGFVSPGSVHLVALSAAIALGAGTALTAANQQLALTNAIELVELAHAEARTTALRTGRRIRLQIDGRGSRLRVTFGSLNAPGAAPLVRELRPESVTLETAATVLCFDGLGRPTTGHGCSSHTGTIEVRALTGAAVLTLSPDGGLTR